MKRLATLCILGLILSTGCMVAERAVEGLSDSGASPTAPQDSLQRTTATPEAIPKQPDVSEKLQLRLSVPKGQTYRMRLTTDQTITQTSEGQSVVTRQTLRFDYTFTATEDAIAGNTVFSVTYDAVFFEQDGPAGSFRYDSANPPDEVPLQARGFAAMMGRGFSMLVSPEGEVLEVQGVDQMIEDVIADLGAPDDPAVASLIDSLKQQFGDKALKESMGNIFVPFPAADLGIGDTWTTHQEISYGVPMIEDTTWTLVSRDGSVATLAVSSIVNPNTQEGPLDLGGVTILYAIGGTQEGTVLVDERTGWTIASDLVQSFSGEMTLTMGETEVKTPLTIEATLRVETLAE
ncbi:MAG TPA: DUF6263 family protein [Anaerolineales bacterium]|nr:DUF6263 family protein [Anaerolineales bacterium]